MFYTTEQQNIIDMLFSEAQGYHSTFRSFGTFFEKEILPTAKKTDQDEAFPRENLKKLTHKGIMALPFPEKYNGSGLPFPVYIGVLEMLAKACANTALQVSIQGMVCDGLLLFGNDRQKETFLKERGLIEGKSLIAFALTEPCCGSDAKSIQTRAEGSGDMYILNGNKILITNASEADVILVFARTDKGISSFLVPRETSGCTITKSIAKLGFRGNSLSAINFSNCAVPKENILGEEGHGLEQAKHMLNSGRLSIAAIGVGIAHAAYEKSLLYAGKRKAFGEPLAGFQLVQEKISNMITGINAARLLTYHAAYLKHKGGDVASGAAQAKLFSSETALSVCDTAIQIHGGYGYIDAFDVHRHWRDARMLTIGEGTSDMLRLLIAHQELKDR